MRFVKNSAPKRCTEKGHYGDGNGGKSRLIPSEDTRRQITDQTLQGNCPEVQIFIGPIPTMRSSLVVYEIESQTIE